jgi:hypothetical protein
MPSSPVRNSVTRMPRAAGVAVPAAVGGRADKVKESPAQSRFSAAQTNAVRRSPTCGTRRNAAASTPVTAPNVLAA